MPSKKVFYCSDKICQIPERRLSYRDLGQLRSSLPNIAIEGRELEREANRSVLITIQQLEPEVFLLLQILRREPVILYIVCEGWRWLRADGSFDERHIVRDRESELIDFGKYQFQYKRIRGPLFHGTLRSERTGHKPTLYLEPLGEKLIEYLQRVRSEELGLNAINFTIRRFNRTDLVKFSVQLLERFKIIDLNDDELYISIEILEIAKKYRAALPAPLREHSIIDEDGNQFDFNYVLNTRAIYRGSDVSFNVSFFCRSCGRRSDQEFTRNDVEGHLSSDSPYEIRCDTCNRMFSIRSDFISFGKHRIENVPEVVEDIRPIVTPIPRNRIVPIPEIEYQQPTHGLKPQLSTQEIIIHRPDLTDERIIGELKLRAMKLGDLIIIFRIAEDQIASFNRTMLRLEREKKIKTIMQFGLRHYFVI